MIIVKEGKSTYNIVYTKEKVASKFAATELSKYLGLSLSTTLKVVELNENKVKQSLYIGCYYSEEQKKEIALTDLNGDGFVLEVTENGVYLNSKIERGLIFGVYRILEKYLGIRFFNIDSEKIPVHQIFELELGKVVEKPTFALRSYLNGKMLVGEGVEYDIYHLKHKMCNEHRHLSPELGGECLMYGRGGGHNMVNYVPYETYKDTHPEFYAFNESLGYRTIDLLNGITEDGKLDESVEVSVAKIVIEELKKDIIANPESLYFQFEQEDGPTYHVYEAGSKKAQILEKYGRSGILIRFCNLIATELQKWANKELNGRKIYISTFSYDYTKYPPVKKENGKIVPIDSTVVPVDNLILRMAFSPNGAYPYLDEHQTDILDRISGWKAICSKFMFWGYDTDFVTYFWYFPTLKNIRKNIDELKKMNFIYFMLESADGTLSDWQTDLKAYIYGALMWNSELKVNDLYNEYMDFYYGPAAKNIKKIVAILENYSIYLREIYDGYWIETYKYHYRHANLQNYKLLDKLLSLFNDAR